MKRQVMMAALAMGMASNLAQADVPRPTYRWTDPSRIGAPWLEAANVSHVIYLNNCQPNGCQIRGTGYDDSTTNQSSIASGTINLSGYQGSSSQWNQIVQCVQQTYAPFNVQIVTTRPTSGHYHMAIVGGSAAEFGESQGVLGVSPFTCGYIPDAISYTFANELPSDIYQLCWTVAQETSHSWGLDHKYDNRDPMTYLDSGPQWKQFQDQTGSCGEYSSRQCNCTYPSTGSQENSYQLIMSTFGPSGPDNTPPTVKITSPANGASVTTGFAVTANVSDNVGITSADLKIDGQLVKSLDSDPWQWTAPGSVGQGSHHVEVTATDIMGNKTTDAVDVMIGHACQMASDCTNSGDVCIDGHCVAGPGEQGGLGTNCTKDGDCASGQCGADGNGNAYCVDPCDTSKNQCPSGFSCISSGAGPTSGVCWPGGDDGGGSGGCNTNNANGALLMVLALGAMMITRKRRR